MEQTEQRRSSLELVQSISKSVQETKQIVKEVPVSKSNFLMLVFYLGELQPLVEELSREDQQLLNSFPVWTSLNRLERTVTAMNRFTKGCTNRSRVFLLYSVENLIKDMRGLVRDLADELSAILSHPLPTVLKEGFENLKEKLGKAGFFIDSTHQLVVNQIMEGLAAHRVDNEPFATSLLRRIADSLSVPLPAAAELKLELQRDLETAELQSEHPHLQVLRDLCELLNPAAALADVQRLAVEESGFPRYGSLSMNSSFICPIRGQVMRDPVMLVEAGFTYEKEAICEWFDRGHRTCPDTGKELESLELVPNYNLRQAIEEFSDRASRRELMDAIDTIRQREHEKIGDNEIQEAVDTIKSLSDTHPKYRRLIASMDGIQPLVGIVKQQKEKMPNVWDKVLKLLVNIAAIGDEYRILVKKAGVIPTLIRHLWRTDGENLTAMQLLLEISKLEEGVSGIIELDKSLVCIAHATNANSLELGSVAWKILENVCQGRPEIAIKVASYRVFGPLVAMLSSGKTPDIRAGMARAVVDLRLDEEGYTSLVETGAIQPLLDLLKGGQSKEEVHAAAEALQHLSGMESCRVAICKAGAIPALVQFLSSDDQDIRLRTVSTLANLAADHQGATEIDHEGAVSRLFDMLKLDLDTLVHEYALTTLQCMTKESKTVRSRVKDLGGGPYLIRLLQAKDLSGASRSSILHLLSHLADDQETRECVILSEEVVGLLIGLLNQPTDTEEQESIMVIFAGQAKIQHSTELLLSQEFLVTLVKFLDGGSLRTQECAALTLSKLLSPGQSLPTGGEYHQLAGRLGAVQSLTRLLTGGSLQGKCCAALALGLLSKQSPRLTEKLTFVQKVGCFLGGKKFKSCKVHGGKCNPWKTLCLVESGAANCLIKLLEEKEIQTAEKAIEALSTLIEPEENKPKGLNFLVKNDAIAHLIGVVGNSPSLTEKAVKLIEEICRDRRFRDLKYWDGVQSKLGVIMATGQGTTRRVAAQAMVHLGLFAKDSTYTS